MALWNLSGTTQVSRYQKKHSPTHTHCGHQSSLSAFSIYYDPWHPPYSIHVLYSLFPQSLSKFSLVYLFGLVPSASYSIHFFTQEVEVRRIFLLCSKTTVNVVLLLDLFLQVSVTDKLYSYIHYLWLENAPIAELS